MELLFFTGWCILTKGVMNMCIPFGKTHKGEQASLYTIKNEKLTAKLTDFGATLVQLWVPDKNGICLLYAGVG